MTHEQPFKVLLMGLPSRLEDEQQHEFSVFSIFAVVARHTAPNCQIPEPPLFPCFSISMISSLGGACELFLPSGFGKAQIFHTILNLISHFHVFKLFKWIKTP